MWTKEGPGLAELITGSFKGSYRVPLKGLCGSFWADISRVQSWYNDRDLEVQGTYNWLHICSYNWVINHL